MMVYEVQGKGRGGMKDHGHERDPFGAGHGSGKKGCATTVSERKRKKRHCGEMKENGTRYYEGGKTNEHSFVSVFQVVYGSVGMKKKLRRGVMGNERKRKVCC